MKNYRWVATCGLLIFIGLLSGVPRNTTSGQSGTPPYKDSSLAIEKRVDDLVSRMNLAEKVSQMMNAAPAIEHLDIAEYEWWNEGLHGVARAGYATVFPQAIGLAATWDTDLMNQVADVISTEARATPKHYAVHSGPEPERHAFDAKVSERDLRETYLPAFRATEVEAQGGWVMCAYNRTNTEPCCANNRLVM